MLDSKPERTFALIKPDAMKSGSTGAILHMIHEAGFTVVAQQKLQLTKEKAAQFYVEHEGKPFYPRLLEFMTSGPVLAMVLSKSDAITHWRNLLGPTNVTKAKMEAPNSIRALHGFDGTMNAAHGSDSPASAEREIGFFFPTVAEAVAKEAAIAIPEELIDEEKTLSLIKPDAVHAGYAEEILQMIRMAGFTIVVKKKVTLTRDMAEQFYQEHSGKEFFPKLVNFMISGPLYALILAKPGAIGAWRELMGPTSAIRARETAPKRYEQGVTGKAAWHGNRSKFHSHAYATCTLCLGSVFPSTTVLNLRALFGADGTRNATHGSDSPASATRELKFFFPDLGIKDVQVRTADLPSSGAQTEGIERTLAIIKPDAVHAGHAKEILQLIERAGFTIIRQEFVQLTRERAQEFYFEHKEKEFFPKLADFMTSGPVFVLVLAKRDGIKAWRAMMGPTNTHKAKQEAPCSLRALYGSDGTKNATHGSDSTHSAQREIKFFFPQLVLEEAVSEPTQADDYIIHHLQPTLLKGLTCLAREKPTAEKYEAITYLAQWLLNNNPNKPRIITPDQWSGDQAYEEDEIDALEREQESELRRAAEVTVSHTETPQKPGATQLADSTGDTLAFEVITADGETEDADALNNAATKVQAGWRGHQARKSVAKMKEDAA